MRHGLAEGDGEAVCGLLTERGQAITLRLARTESKPPIEAESCEEAVEKSVVGLSRRELREVDGGPDYTAQDVDVDPTDDEGYNEKTDTTDAERASRYVEVPCKDSSGNSWFAVREDEEEGWRLMVPVCTGR